MDLLLLNSTIDVPGEVDVPDSLRLTFSRWSLETRGSWVSLVIQMLRK